VSEQRLYYTYSDGVNHGLKTDDFIWYISGAKDSSDGFKKRIDSFTLVFSSPPDEQRLVAIIRNYENYVTPPTTDEYRAALVDKYGAPSETPYGKQVWYFPAGTVNCVVGGFSPLGQKDILKTIFENAQGGGVTTRLLNMSAKSLDDCASYLEYSVSPVPSEPATSVTATMVDVQSWARANLSANEWVEGLRRDAISKREGKSDKPAL
jgi:hypothetical protein